MSAATLIDVLEDHVVKRPTTVAYRYLEDGEHETATLTFLELAQRAKSIASLLRSQNLAGLRVMLAIRHELAFLQALLGCFYAGVVAVPAAIPRRPSEVVTLQNIAVNANAKAILLSRQDEKLHSTLLSASCELPTLYSEDAQASPEPTAIPLPQADDLVFLQYTSGSTGVPKGVQITHGNLFANECAIKQAMQLGDETIFVSWLPLFHDMGLVGSALQPLFLGVTCVLMPPHAFLMKPIRWLKAISHYRGTTSGAPNFAYDLCVDKTSEEQRAALDLSSWTVAFNGSEPVRAATLDRFATAFEPAGFKPGAFYPCYGMAESTLIVSGPVPGTQPLIRHFQANSLQLSCCSVLAENDELSKTVVACGSAVLGTEIVIVDPQTRQQLPAEHVGEIWIKGPSVTSGYNAAPEKTAAAFDSIATDQTQQFLRTGDLGCLRGGFLFVLGRLRDIIIIRGRKYYPQDLEATATLSSPLLAAGGAAAFALEDGRTESLTIVHELTRQGWRTADPSQVVADIRESLTREFGVVASRIALIKPGTLPRTTSGKVRRAHCRDLLLKDGFEQLLKQQVATNDAINIESTIARATFDAPEKMEL